VITLIFVKKYCELLVYKVGVAFYMKGKVIFTHVLLTNSEQVISDRKIVSSSELLC